MMEWEKGRGGGASGDTFSCLFIGEDDRCEFRPDRSRVRASEKQETGV
jgi:hypothetical protein